MSKRERACTGKQPFPSADAAITAARYRYLRTGDVTYPYRCPHCGSYHNGHPRETWEEVRSGILRCRASERAERQRQHAPRQQEAHQAALARRAAKWDVFAALRVWNDEGGWMPPGVEEG